MQEAKSTLDGKELTLTSNHERAGYRTRATKLAAKAEKVVLATSPG
jgi:hypothetical protein